MSVLIKDMDMPETCDQCPFHHYHSGGEYVCTATPMLYPMNLANSKGIRKTWCPLSEAPEPCEDAVSRKAVRHSLCKAVHKDEPIPCENQTASCLSRRARVCDYVREIDALPPVTPQPKIEERTAESAQNVLDGDSISRKAVIDLWDKYYPYISVKAAEFDCMLRKLSPTQPEPGQNTRTEQPKMDGFGVKTGETCEAEFWRKRAEEYRAQCISLAAKIGRGIKLDVARIDENGITFEKQKSEQRWTACNKK